ncbi:MAG: hypothetical protein LBP81_00775, partial [Treponema sp.]|nr:hypothetical protein [Treponema sp.]
MNSKKIALCWSIFACCAGMAFAQSFGSVDNDKAETETVVDEQKGFTAQVDIDTSLFQATQTEFSDAKERFREGESLHRTNSFLIDNYPFGGFNVLDDTNVSFGYNGNWYGGNLSLNSGGMGGVKAWLSFFDGKFKISAGNDIGYGYADSQGADAGLRVYDDHVRTSDDRQNATVDSSKNPDNITQDKGILFEFDLDPFKIAAAGGGNIGDVSKNIGSLMSAANDEPIYGHSFQYGINAGGRIGGGLAKVNGAYILQSVKDVSEYRYNSTAGKIVAISADAETWNHLFGLYASLYPWRDDRLGITLGYAGVFIKYLEEYDVNFTTAMPQLLKHGVNLTARYKTDALTIKTDHNYSFWSDKNYNIYNLYKPAEDKMKDYGLEADTSAVSSMADVAHSFLWNGIGASYRFSPVIEGSIYTRNLLRTDESPEYKMTTMYFSLELKSTFRLGPHVEAYGGLTWHYTGRTA